MDREELLFDSLRGLHLLAKASKSTVVSDLCGLQAQFANNPKYALRIRASDFSEANWGDGLVKIWSFRSTLHAVRVDEIGLFLSARGVPDAWDDSWTGLKKEIKPYWCDFIYARILEGTSGRDQLKRACLNKGMDQDLLEKVFHGWGGLLKEMSARGMIAYDIGTDKRFVVCRDMEPMDQDEARTALIRRYFTSYGPATIADCATFTGFMLRETRRLIEQSGMPLESALCDGVEHFTLPPSTHSSPQEAASINRKVPE